MKVWLVGVAHAEGNSVKSVHRTEAGALAAWKVERDRLIVEFKEHAEYAPYMKKMYQAMINNLRKCKPHNNGGIHETPYVEEREVQP